MDSQASTRQPLSLPRRWGKRGARVAALSLTLTACAARTLTTAPAWAAGGYTRTATVRVGQYPIGVAASPDGKHAYVANQSVPGSVSVINTATDRVTATIAVGSDPYWVAVSPNGTRAYVTNLASSSVSVIDTATNQVTATIHVGAGVRPIGVAFSPDGTRAYITQSDYPSFTSGGSVSVIDTATRHVTATVHRLCYPWGVAVSPSGTHIYVTNSMARGTVSVITSQ